VRIKITEVIDPPKGFSQSQVTAISIKGTPKKDTLYDLVEIDEYTEAQRNLFESLPKLYFNSLCFQYEARNIIELREQIKIHLGKGYSKIKYTDHNYNIITIKYKDKNTIPRDVIEDYNRGNIGRIELIVRSTTTYTKPQFVDMVDSLIREMLVSGVLLTKQGKKFAEILEKIKFTE